MKSLRDRDGAHKNCQLKNATKQAKVITKMWMQGSVLWSFHIPWTLFSGFLCSCDKKQAPGHKWPPAFNGKGPLNNECNEHITVSFNRMTGNHEENAYFWISPAYLHSTSVICRNKALDTKLLFKQITTVVNNILHLNTTLYVPSAFIDHHISSSKHLCKIIDYSCFTDPSETSHTISLAAVSTRGTWLLFCPPLLRGSLGINILPHWNPKCNFIL